MTTGGGESAAYSAEGRGGRDARSARLAAALGGAAPSDDGGAWFEGEWPEHALVAALGSTGSCDAMYWCSPSSGVEWLAVGVADRIDASGPGRFVDVVRAAAEAAPSSVPWLASFAFLDEPLSPRWAAFASAEAFRPRALLSRERGGIRVWRCGAAPAVDIDAVCAALTTGAVALRAVETVVVRPPRDHAFRDLVEVLRGHLTSNDIPKIVAARRVDLPGPVDVAATLARLDPSAYRFALRRDGCTFFGASPELLLSKNGTHATTVALAGSAPPEPSRIAALRASTKDAEEHRLVVQHVTRTLQAAGATLDVAAHPRLRATPTVVHLETPIRASLPRDLHILDVVAALHPTPAVGGTPRDAAIAWIRAHEHADRGLYAGPIGWFDGRGDGEFAVALRCALTSPEGTSLYAGAGIIRTSNPDAELDETEQKLGGMWHALGIA